MRILLVKLSSMGDVVHNLPVATDIRQEFPHAVIDWAVEPLFAPIVSLHPAVRRVYPIPLRTLKQHWWSPARWGRFLAARKALGEEPYDLVLDTQGLLKSALVAKHARGPKAGFDSASAREPAASRCYTATYRVSRNLHAVMRNRALAAAALKYDIPQAVDYGLSGSIQSGGKCPPDVVCLTATSRTDKQWPTDAWRELLRRLCDCGARVVLPWGNESEHAECVRIAENFDHVSIPPRAPLNEVVQWLAHANVVVGVDTGLAHLAVALGRPTVGIYVSTQPGLTGLYGRDDSLNLGGGTRENPAPPTVDAVWLAVKARLGTT